jgi:hypothetical protein
MATKICYWWSQSVVYNEGSPVPPYKYFKYEYLHVLVSCTLLLAMTQRSFGGAQTTRVIDSKQLQGKASAAKTNIYSINSRPTL